jgi:hypothetical protein
MLRSAYDEEDDSGAGYLATLDPGAESVSNMPSEAVPDGELANFSLELRACKEDLKKALAKEKKRAYLEPQGEEFAGDIEQHLKELQKLSDADGEPAGPSQIGRAQSFLLEEDPSRKVTRRSASLAELSRALSSASLEASASTAARSSGQYESQGTATASGTAGLVYQSSKSRLDLDSSVDDEEIDSDDETAV